MRRLLTASAAAIGLAVALPAFAQVPDPVPATPPVTTQPPPVQQSTEQGVDTDPSTPTPEAGLETQSGVTAAEPLSPDAGPAATAAAPPVIADVSAASASAAAVCQPRTTAVTFGARSSALNRDSRNELEYAADAASVCSLQRVEIVDGASGAVSQRRAQAVRATLIRQGVPADIITVADADAGEPTRLEVRMSFDGVAHAQTASLTSSPAAAEAPEADLPPETEQETGAPGT